VSVDEVPKPTIQAPADAIVRITTSAICGADLHFIRGTMAGMPAWHDPRPRGGRGGRRHRPLVRNFNLGDRVVIPSTIGCGSCVYCRAGYYAQCDNANPNGKNAGTAFYGGPSTTGPFDGLQAEYARVPFAHTNLVAIPPGVTDEQAIMVSDIFPDRLVRRPRGNISASRSA
jgi:threonine dehydrogenase-like Zn-dependent dehydrogenase